MELCQKKKRRDFLGELNSAWQESYISRYLIATFTGQATEVAKQILPALEKLLGEIDRLLDGAEESKMRYSCANRHFKGRLHELYRAAILSRHDFKEALNFDDSGKSVARILGGKTGGNTGDVALSEFTTAVYNLLKRTDPNEADTDRWKTVARIFSEQAMHDDRLFKQISYFFDPKNKIFRLGGLSEALRARYLRRKGVGAKKVVKIKRQPKSEKPVVKRIILDQRLPQGVVMTSRT